MIRALILLSLGCALSSAQGITGRVVSVHDGDTFTLLTDRFERVTIRLWLIDAPELKQRGGPESAAALAKLLRVNDFQLAKVDCVKRGQSYGRIVAECAANTRDLSTEMVRGGHALVYDPKGNVLRRMGRAMIPARSNQAIRERELKVLEVKSISPGADIRKCAPWSFRKGKCK